jgi:Ca2+-transporting ATPase
MVTGDHEATARHIAGHLDIDDVYARVTPEQKLELIARFQRDNQVVAMTGDGVNDAPALKHADIGIAMGKRGTAVAREASSMVLVDDNFGTIVEAIAQGRAIFGNIRKFVVYLLACNASEVMVVAFATLAGTPLPLLPLQILFLNLVTDVFPALALGLGEGAATLMRERPRPASERILMRRHWIRIAVRALLIAVAVLGAMAAAVFVLGFDTRSAVTVSFCTLALAQVWHVFNMRDDTSPRISNEVTRNPFVWGAVLICVLLIAAAVYVPVLADVLSLSAPGLEGWALILVASLLPVMISPFLRIRPAEPAPD